MANFDIDSMRDDKQAKVTPIACGTPTQEEMEEAFEEMFQTEWRKNT